MRCKTEIRILCGKSRFQNSTKTLNEVTSKEDSKKRKDGTSMERADIEKKVEMIAGKSGKELKQTIMKMYPNLFKGLGKTNLNIRSS